MEKNQDTDLRKIIAFFFARGMPAIINFFAMSFYAHHLLPAEYGNYSLSLVWSNFLSSLLFSWLNMSLLRFFEENKNSQEDFLYTLRNTFAILGSIFLVFCLSTYYFFHHIVIYIALLAIAQGFFQLCLQLLVSEVRPIKYAILSVLSASLTF